MFSFLKPKLTICLLCAFFATGALAQESLAWQLTYFSTPSAPLVGPDQLTVDSAGNAYLTYESEDNVHLTKVTPDRATVFDKLIGPATFGPNLPEVFYMVNSVKSSAGTALSPARVTVFATQTVYPINAPEVDSIWMCQYDQTGKPLWPKPLLITPPANALGYPSYADFIAAGVGADGTVYLSYEELGANYLESASPVGVLSKPVKTQYYCTQRLPDGAWLTGDVEVGTAGYTWGIVNGSTGLLKFQAPLPSLAADQSEEIFANLLPDGNFFVVESMGVTTQSPYSVSYSYRCDIYSPAGVKLETGPLETGEIRRVIIASSGGGIYLVGEGGGASQPYSQFLESISSSLAVNWTKNQGLAQTIADRNGLFYTYATGNEGTYVMSMNHLNMAGALDFQTRFQPSSVFAGILYLGTNGTDTYFTESALELLQNGKYTHSAEFNLMRVVSGTTISSFTYAPVKTPDSVTTFTVKLSAPAPAGGYQLTLSSSDPHVNFIDRGKLFVQKATLLIPQGQTSVQVAGYVGNPSTTTVLITADFNGIFRYLNLTY